jgi:hypothetical protein
VPGFEAQIGDWPVCHSQRSGEIANLQLGLLLDADGELVER